MDYLDFEVDVSPGQSGDYEVNVRSEFGEATGDFRLPFDALALQNRLQALQLALLRSTSGTRGVATPEEATVERFGRELFGALFQDGPILGRFHAARDGAEERDVGLRVKLRIDAPDLAALPWEYLYDPERGDFLGLSIATPVVRYIALPRPIKPFATRPPLRILGLIAATADLPNLDESGSGNVSRSPSRSPSNAGRSSCTGCRPGRGAISRLRCSRVRGTSSISSATVGSTSYAAKASSTSRTSPAGRPACRRPVSAVCWATTTRCASRS